MQKNVAHCHVQNLLAFNNVSNIIGDELLLNFGAKFQR